LENQLCKVEFDLGKKETVSRICGRHKKGTKTRNTILKEKINQKRSCEITKRNKRQSSVDKKDSKSSEIMSSNDKGNSSDTNLSKSTVEIYFETKKEKAMRHKNNIFNEECFEEHINMVKNVEHMERINVSIKTGRQMDRNKQLGFCVECSLGQKKSKNKIVKKV
jgi:hypothetical protein